MSNALLSSLYPQHLATLQARAAEALRRGGFDHLAIPSGTLHYQAFDDRDYPYAVNPQFKAWLPLTQAPGSWLVITPGQRPRLIFLQPHDYWHVVPEMPSDYWVEHFDIEVIRTADEAMRLLPPAFRCAIVGEPQSALGGYVPNNPEPVVQYLEYHRAFKTPYEIEMMRKASHIGIRAHRAAERAFRAGSSEFGIHLAYCQAAGQDANDLPYGNIIALNEHGAVLHLHPPRPPAAQARAQFPDRCRRQLRRLRGRHHPHLLRGRRRVRGDGPRRRRRPAQAVRHGARGHPLRAHPPAGALAAGWRAARDFGVIRVSPEDALASGVSSAFFPHGIGHGIGLQVHDVAGFAASDQGGTLPKPDGHPYLRLTRTLEPGMVVTIEPGVYFIDMLLDELKAKGLGDAVDWERVETFKPCGGIRIEDDVACTEAEPVNLTREAFAAS